MDADTLVTGAAGFIGSHLSEALLERGYSVRGFDDLSSGKPANLPDDKAFEFVEGDVRSSDAVREAVEGVDYIFHHAAETSVQRSIEDPVETTDVNCLGTTRLIDAAADAGAEKVVVASSAAVYGSQEPPPPLSEDDEVSPESPYALSKLWTEEIALQHDTLRDLDAVALRYFNVYGPRQDPEGEYAAVIPKFVTLMDEGRRPTVYGDGEQTRDFVYVGDVVEANLRAAESDYHAGVVNVASGERVSVNQLVEVLNEVLGTELEPVYEDPRPGEVRHSVADVSKAREMLGFVAETGMVEGLRETVADMRAR
ncbi:MAG: GDP-mannose 4,6-dehydratase [Halobacteriales archaeon]|nr:GDP-mannose 4,6-dehydratase [Halobacteriales archaeon]